jgi:hypothetical protein
MLDQGVWAEVKVGDEHVPLFAEHNALGVQAVYNVIAKTWIAPSEPVDDLEQGKERAAAHAQQYLKGVGNLELPPCDGRNRDPRSLDMARPSLRALTEWRILLGTIGCV